MTPQEAASKYPWIRFDPEKNEIEMFLDHQMLSTLRMCEGKFVLEHSLNFRPKGHKAWSLVFGAWMHYCLETFYEHIRTHEGKPPDPMAWLDYAKNKWSELHIQAYANDTKFEDIGGWEGACSLLVQYYAFYMEQRLRVVACEIPFGYDREVYLGSFHIWINGILIEVKCYLTGRIDMLVDNGSVIGPVDHKHTHLFRGDEWDKFNPHDGITGYIFATNKIIERYFPGYKKPCLTGWIFHIQGKHAAKARNTGEIRPRFKASRIDKMPSMLDDYAARNVSTFQRIAALLFENKIPEWNTTACHNIYNKDCEYLQIHKQPREEWAYQIQQFYHITTPWNPNKPEESIIERDDVMNIPEVTALT
jgi:PD-(D/E)XK nuclease superfamily